ncbi:hypothetical protein F5Y09DRAFT_339239 [Xylaria sp. FL1042]|nr:hypothetical protein F5Y09DRAFT_339239 [Xylaria sp. FL1042]
MASKSTYIPRFLLPQYGPMWRTAVRSAALGRPLNIEVGQVMVRYASKTALSRPTAAKSAVTKLPTQRTAWTKSAASAKAAKASAPKKPPPKNATKTSASTAHAPQKPAAPKAVPTSTAPTTSPAPASAPAPASKPVVQAVAPKPAVTPPSTPSPSKPIVLEKPERFNPPSHGSRLPRSTPRHYGGSMTAEEVQAQSQRSYPGLPPPPNSWSHWFIHNTSIHAFISLGTLLSLAFYTFSQNFKENSPYVGMIPPISQLLWHPIQYIGICLTVLRLHEEYESAQTAEKRRRNVDDVTKREEYRKAHGLPPATPWFFPLFGLDKLAEEAEAADGASQTAEVVKSSEPEPEPEPEPNAAAESASEGKRKKFLGIF